MGLAGANEVQRISGAIPTIQRLGYALGTAYVGIVANASGLLSIETAADAAKVARWIFASCVPFAAIGLIAMRFPRQKTLGGRLSDMPSGGLLLKVTLPKSI
ncbi:hypothetical protein [Foliimonas ilicis]|uniref:hypothetical protein n=1 Tax=Mesorhizobium sp. SB112 TaxID=3151853 RepID=UPI0032637F4F